MYRKASGWLTETPKSLTRALMQWHFDCPCSSENTEVSQTVEKQSSDCTEHNCNIYFIIKLWFKSNFDQTELLNVGFLNITNRVKQLRLGHRHNIYNNKCLAYLKENVIEC